MFALGEHYISQMLPTLFLVAQVCLIFLKYIAQIYLNCTSSVGGVLHPSHPPGHYVPVKKNYNTYGITAFIIFYSWWNQKIKWKLEMPLSVSGDWKLRDCHHPYK